MTEEQMYTRLFLKQTGREKKSEKQGESKDGSQPYASFDCPECVQMASMMLDEELRYYMSKSGIKKKGAKSKDALFKQSNSMTKNG